MQEKRNKYDYLLSLMIILLSAGNIGGWAEPARVLIWLLIPFYVRDHLFLQSARQAVTKENVSFKYELLLFITWGFYSLLSLYWAMDFNDSAKSLMYITTNFIGFGEILWLASKADMPQHSILKGWLIMILITMPIALYEFIYDTHLAMSVQEEGASMRFGSEIVERRFASVTYGNLNTYNIILCMAFSMMLILAFNEQKKKRKMAYLMLFAISGFIINNNSRGAILCIAGGIALLWLLKFKYYKLSIEIFILPLLVFAGIVWCYQKGLFALIALRFADQGLEDVGRLDMIIYGIEDLMNSYGFGIGIGNFAPFMMKYHPCDLAAPHNLWLEIIEQFGIYIFLGFLGMFIRIHKRAKHGSRQNYIATILGITLLIPISIIDSVYLLSPYIWFYIASLYVLSLPQYNYHD